MTRVHRIRTSCLFAAGMVLVLGACQPEAPPPGRTSDNDAPAPKPETRAASSVVEGQAIYRERMMLPPGSRLTVQLVDNRLADTPKAVIAETTVEDVGAPPIAFSLSYPADALRPDGMYGLHASLRGPDGQLMFVTDTRQALDVAGAVPVELLLKRVAASPAAFPDADPDAGIASHHLQCGDLRVDAELRAGGASLSVSGRPLSLSPVEAGAGRRYEDGLGNALTLIDDSFSLSLAGQPAVPCSPAGAPSPWTEAASRDVAFRAVGNEPGWWVEVSRGQSPRLKAELDYGARSIEVAEAQPRGLGYAGNTADGSSVTLDVERKPCQDGMSGESFEATARLTVDATTYSGCGAFLAH